MTTIVRRRLPLAATVLVLACADFALEADRIPASMEVSAHSSLLVKGETAKLDVIVRDQDGEVMTLPSWAPLVWEVQEPGIADVAADGTISTKRGGETVVLVKLGDLGAASRIRVNPAQVVLSAPLIQVTQATQTRDNDVRLIAGRRTLVRVFMVGDETSFYGPGVRIRILQGDDEIFQQVFAPERDRTPEEVDESILDGSVNGVIPASAMVTGARMVVELDPENLVPKAAGSQTRYPAEGSMALNIVEPQPFRHVVVPSVTVGSGNESVISWASTMSVDHPYMSLLQALMPVGEMELEIHEPFRVGYDLTNPGNSLLFLQDILTMYQQEGRRGYYYGATSQSMGGILGRGYIGLPASKGINRNDTHVHEVGHNMNLYHAPGCGAGGPDPNYPYGGGGIGVWGYDFFRNTLKNPRDLTDVMTYCDQIWISDYHFGRATDHRLVSDGGYTFEPPPAASDPTGEMLVVRGFVENGELTMEPAFVVTGPPALPESGGPYRVEGIGVDGRTEFSLPFRPTPVSKGGGGFVFLVPYQPEWAQTLDRMVLTGPEGVDTMTRDGSAPMAVVTDPSTGQIRAIVRNWDGGPLPGEGVSRVTITRGIPLGGGR